MANLWLIILLLFVLTGCNYSGYDVLFNTYYYFGDPVCDLKETMNESCNRFECEWVLKQRNVIHKRSFEYNDCEE